ncbi:MAG TPA: DUF4037 domain-containing protein [Allosphingosinicella sp.]|jgi:hypothetical protein
MNRRAFEPGLALARRFFQDAVEPALERLVPGLAYGAALVGDGSEVLGFDDEISCDHDWGPRVLLFLAEVDFERHAAAILTGLERALPATLGGWPTAFPDQDRRVGIDRERRCAGSELHGVEAHVLDYWLARQLDRESGRGALSPAEWLRLDGQRLLSVVAGEVFRDDRGELAEARRRLAWYPEEVVRAKLARLWAAAGSEMPFVGRAGLVGDEIGSRLIASRLAEHAVRITFLIDGRYAPYSKWLGKAWGFLPSAPALAPHLEAVLAAIEWRQREAALVTLFATLAQRQMDAGVADAVPPRVGHYFSRPFKIVNADEIAASLRAGIADPQVREWSQWQV